MALNQRQMAMEANIDRMNPDEGYDVVIVCTTTDQQAHYWQCRLDATRGQIASSSATIIAVSEDWKGGAGNALGTLYAYEKACKIAEESLLIDLKGMLAKKAISVALFHTAGKGTRLAPLPGSENNNKPGVKLPCMLTLKEGVTSPMSILEAVIKQTGVYASSRKGRLSVFWGDQVFIPSASTRYAALHHIDILATLCPMPTEREWVEKGLDKYGVIAVSEAGNAAQIEKVTHQTATRLLQSLGNVKSVGISLGSFSVSFEMLTALLDEFSCELTAKEGKLDADPHFWMPLTLEEGGYVELMKQKGVEECDAIQQYHRMAALKADFCASGDGRPLFGCVDVGEGCYWWDYGQVGLYYRNNLMLTEETVEAKAMRRFFGVERQLSGSSLGDKMDADKASCLLHCLLEEGRVKNSVLCNVNVKDIDVQSCVMVNVSAKKVKARGCLLYNIAEEDLEGINLKDGSIVAGLYLPNGKKRIIESSFSFCPGKFWQDKVCSNDVSFEEVYKLNMNADISSIETMSRREHLRVVQTLAMAG